MGNIMRGNKFTLRFVGYPQRHKLILWTTIEANTKAKGADLDSQESKGQAQPYPLYPRNAGIAVRTSYSGTGEGESGTRANSAWCNAFGEFTKSD